MAINIALARTSATLLSTSILVLLIASCSSTSLGNVLQAGDKLTIGNMLSIGNYNFKMQYDCNLVLYLNDNAIWASNTAGKGTNCNLLLQSNGELFIYSGSGSMVWRSETGGAYGKYTLVLQPNGNIVVYGSPVWSTGTSYQSAPVPTRKTFNGLPPNSVNKNP